MKKPPAEKNKRIASGPRDRRPSQETVNGRKQRWDDWDDPTRSRKRSRKNRGPSAENSTAADAQSENAVNGKQAGDCAGIVAEVQKFSYTVMHGDDYVRCDVATASIPVEIDPLVVGDRVTFDVDHDGRGVIRQVLPRTTKLARMREDSTRRSEYAREEHILAANVDVGVIVASAAAPPFHPRLIDRYLLICQHANVAPVICVNKSDLVEELPDLGAYERVGIPTLLLSAATGAGLEELLRLLRGKCSVLTGHSGVGKSSIINRLLGDDILRVGNVGGKHGRGRHTTTVSTLHKLDDATLIIDTPGIRALGLWKIDKHTLKFYFPEFGGVAPNCKFRDCAHLSEPGCAVRSAAARGTIPAERYESYVRLMNE